MNLLKQLKKYKEELLDIVYPKICLGCKNRIPADCEKYLCSACLDKLQKIKPPLCTVCGKPIDDTDVCRCSECSGYKYHFSRGYTASVYEGLIKDCIHNFKYNSHTYLGGTLAGLMADFASSHIGLNKVDLIVPVPLHWRKLRDRGFNQSVILTKLLSRTLGIPFINKGISRIKALPPQAGLPRKDRIRNSHGIFKVTRPEYFCGKHILLIDDVFTTGATVNECSKMLMDCGAKDVWVFSLARGISY